MNIINSSRNARRLGPLLDDTVDPVTIGATLDRGVLALHARKRPETKPRKILVNGAPAQAR